MSQRAFALALTESGLPVDSSAVSRIENGTRDVRLTEAVIVANVLGVDLDRLVGDMQPNEDRVRARLHAMRDAYQALVGAVDDFFEEQARLQRVAGSTYASEAQREQIKRSLEYRPEQAIELARRNREARADG